MAKKGPIIIIEDDAEDEELFKDILQELNISNKIIWFTDTHAAFDFLKTTKEQPFIIFSDVNLPKQNGVEFKKSIDADKQLRKKCIPFIFYSTFVSKEIVNQAYTQMTVQGFFKKGTSYKEIKSDIKMIIDYWQICRHPNTE
jgi:response regulator RpfG family c-di-GMP phosphodiesterase